MVRCFVSLAFIGVSLAAGITAAQVGLSGGAGGIAKNDPLFIDVRINSDRLTHLLTAKS
jgi:hypothetical protein